MFETPFAASSEASSWPLPPGCPADELAQVLGEHDLLDADALALIAELRSRRQAGLPLQGQARAIAQYLTALQQSHQAQLAVKLGDLRAHQQRSMEQLQALQHRLNQDALHLQGCRAQLDALRAVHARMAQELLAGLHVQTVHTELRRMQDESGKAWQRPVLMGRAFAALRQRLQLRLSQAQRRCEEIYGVMSAGYADVGTTFVLTLEAPPPPPLQPYMDELTILSGAYTRQLHMGNLLRLLQPSRQTRLLRQLQLRLVRLFSGATSELEAWSHALWMPAQARLDRLADRLLHRQDAVQRVQVAAEELQQRIVELEAQEMLEQESFGHAQRLLARLQGAEGGSSPELQARAA